MKNILFVCTGNTCRSSMAEALFLYLLKNQSIEDKYKVQSAGVSVYMEMPASKNAIDAMSDIKIDISSHRSKMITKDMIEAADLILTMTKAHKDAIVQSVFSASTKTFTLKEFTKIEENLDILDPYGGSLDIYRECRDEILLNLKLVIEKFEMEG